MITYLPSGHSGASGSANWAREDAYSAYSGTDPIPYTTYNPTVWNVKYGRMVLDNEILALRDSKVAGAQYLRQFTCVAGLAIGDPVVMNGNNTVALAQALVQAKVIGFVRHKGTMGVLHNATATTCYLSHYFYKSGLTGGVAGTDVYLQDDGSYGALPGTKRISLGKFISTTEALLSTAGGGGAEINSLDDIQDVEITGLADGDFISWNAGDALWENVSIGFSGGWAFVEGSSGKSGTSGTSGFSGPSGISGSSGTSGFSGLVGPSGASGPQGPAGAAGVNGLQGQSGKSGTSGFSGTYSGFSGISGYSSESGYSGTSGFSGIGSIGISGQSGFSGIVGASGASGSSGYSGPSNGRALITQTLHGFAVGQVIYRNTGAWARAKADNLLTAEAIGVIESIPDPNTFWVVWDGVFTAVNSLSWTDGVVYFVSDISAGTLTDTPPTTVGYISKPMLVATSDRTGIVSNFRGMVIPDPLANSGMSGASGISGAYGVSGTSGRSGYSGLSGATGPIGLSGTSGSSGRSGYSGISGTSGLSGPSGESGYSGVSGTGFANRQNLINGQFDIWQRGTVFTADGYTADRWYQNKGTGGAPSFSAWRGGINLDYTSGKYMYCVRQIFAATATPPYFEQRIESARTLHNQSVTLQFRGYVSSGSIQVTPSFVQHFGTGGSPSADVTTTGSPITVTITGTKFTQTITVPSVVAKTFGTAKDDYLALRISLPLSTTCYFYSWDYQVEPGTIASPIERRLLQQELALCQRYYWRFTAEAPYATIPSCGGYIYGINSMVYNLSHPPMRAVPIFSKSNAGDWSLYDGGSLMQCSTMVDSGANYSNAIQTRLDCTPTVMSLTIGRSPNIMARNNSAAWVDLDAELY